MKPTRNAILALGCQESGLPVFGRVQYGLSLVELMIAMTIGLFLMVVIGNVFLGSKQTYRTQESLSRLQENGRFAMELLGRNIRSAGFTAISFTPPATKYAAPTATSFSGTAIDYTTTGTVYPLIVSYDSTTDCLDADTTAAYSGRATNSFRVIVGADNIPRLFCKGNAATETAMVDDIQDFQVLFGEDTDNDGNPNRYVTAATGPVKANILTIRVCILVRSNEDNVAPEHQTYVDCSGNSVTATDFRIRRTFSATHNLRNRTP